MDAVFSLFGLKTSGIVGALTITKTGTTARTATFPDAAITVAGLEVANIFTAAQTVPNGTAAAPGIRLTSDAHGLYRFSTLGLGVSVAGVARALLDTNGQLTLFGAALDSSFVTFTSAVMPTSGTRFGGMYAGETSNGSKAGIAFYATENWSTGTATGSSIQFQTTPIGSTTRATVLTVANAGITAAQAVTVPNGTAAAPGLRLTSEASGLYRVSATSLGFAVAGAAAASLTDAGAFASVGSMRAGTQLGVGTAPSTGIGINVTQTALAGATQYGHLLSVTGTSAATGAIQMFTVAPATAAASFTCGQVQGFRYQNVNIGAGSTVTTQFAIRIDALSGAGTNYAFSSAGAGLVQIGDTTDATAIGTAGFAAACGGSFAKSLWVGGTAGNYINIANSTGELRVNGTKVVTAQGAAVADATGAGDVVAQLNALLARCRAHGLIAT